ncbi:N-acetylmuramoyl-L-alanine amidase AmiA [Fundidesulfovibrio magnetotacticus]|uniref:N-acetylmuramoyl-L-alanine amidase n=1 Tax=Fundidesulfovibrio magnetotacticus TaxID=2730080 RepID=A0A6V8LPU6_9BACT|nr:N-acetylmuramoyl-L-alanine amidase [Fundidesulfovibrio magnetotacticus]GFK94572.1 N-acetylmuramoyl-L-alanine amidase AmiA [Fundidesulfovibrio magnetotacticus]
MNRRRALAALSVAGLAMVLPGPALRALAASGQEAASKGHALLLEGKPGEALAALREAARLEPANPWVFNLMGRAQVQAGQPGPAAESFRMALRIDPADGYARMMLDILAQKPLPQPARKEPRHRRASRVEEEARAEMEAYAAKGRAPGLPLLVLDPGHGGADKGVTGASGLAEKDATLDIALKTAVALNASGKAWAALTREADHSVPLWARSAVAGLTGARLFVSLHCGAGLPGRGGVEIYRHESAPSGEEAAAVADLENGVSRFEPLQAPRVSRPDASELVLSWRVQRRRAASEASAAALARELTLPPPLDRVAAGHGPFKVLEQAGCPALIVETGFLSNPGEEAFLSDADRRASVARGLASALTALFA